MQAKQDLMRCPSTDKPWLKYYDENAINTLSPKMSMLRQCNKGYLDNTALNYFSKKTSYKKLLRTSNVWPVLYKQMA